MKLLKRQKALQKSLRTRLTQVHAHTTNTRPLQHNDTTHTHIHTQTHTRTHTHLSLQHELPDEKEQFRSSSGGRKEGGHASSQEEEDNSSDDREEEAPVAMNITVKFGHQKGDTRKFK